MIFEIIAERPGDKKGETVRLKFEMESSSRDEIIKTFNEATDLRLPHIYGHRIVSITELKENK